MGEVQIALRQWGVFDLLREVASAISVPVEEVQRAIAETPVSELAISESRPFHEWSAEEQDAFLRQVAGEIAKDFDKAKYEAMEEKVLRGRFDGDEGF